MIGGLLMALPWIGFVAYLAFRVREPPELPAGSVGAGAPSVSVIVPARNEAREIVGCLDSLAASRYPDFEIVVVDDRSGDGTAALARTVPPGNARRIRVVDGRPLPEGWFGKPWACWQGYREARGELLLFTDADTRHAPDLLARAAAFVEERVASGGEPVGGVSVLGRQILETFWERVVMPHVLLLLVLRFPDLREEPGPKRWREAIASGQHILVRREAYEAVGGHEAVRGEVVEDLRIAQELARSGTPLAVRLAEASMATRMYRSLGEMVEGWSKNLFTGMRQSVPPGGRPWVVPGILAFLGGLWLLPPVVVAAAAGSVLSTGWGGGALTAVAVSVAGWARASARFGIPRRYALLYPLGAAVAGAIILRSWVRGSRIEWKGREYGDGNSLAG